MAAERSRPPRIEEKIVEVEKEVTVVEQIPVEKIVQVVNKEEEKKLRDRIQELEDLYEKTINTNKTEADFRNAARLMSSSEMNKEDLSEDEIYNLLVKSSEDEARRKMGFWAVPLPKNDDTEQTKTTFSTKPSGKN